MNQESQLILGSGETIPWYKTWRLVFLFVAIIIIALISAATWYLSRPVFMPAESLITFVASPRQARAFISEEWFERLPPSWQGAMNKDSRTPCIFGLARGEERLLPYVICHGESQGEGLDWTNGPSATRYELARDSWRYGYADVQLALLSEIVQITMPIQEDETVRFSIEPNRLISDVMLNSMPNAQQGSERTGIVLPVSDADVMLAFSKETWDAIPAVPVNLFPGLPDLQRLKELPAIVQYETWLSASGTPDLRRVRFAQNLSEVDAAKVLMYFGVTQRKQIVLPDGTTSFERVLPQATSGTTMFSTWQNDRGDWIALDPRMMRLSPTSTFRADKSEVPGCKDQVPWLRLSSDVVYQLLRTLDWTNAPSPESLPKLSFGSEKGRLTVCAE